MSKKNKITLFTILLVIITILLFFRVMGFKNKEEYSEDKVKIGVSIPLFYTDAELGGLKLAQKEINEKGGILGKQVDLIVKDDKCDPDVGITKWNELIYDDNVLAILGPTCSQVAESVLSLAQKNNIPVIISGASIPGLTKIGNYIFSNYPSDILQGKFIADYIFTELNKKKVGILYLNAISGIAFKDIVIERFDRFKELGAEVVFAEEISFDEEEIKEKIEKIKDIDIDVLFLPVSIEQSSAILKEIKRMGMDNLIVFGPDSFNQSSPTLEFEGALYSFQKINNLIDFNNRIVQIHTGDIDFMTAYYYNSMKILIQAIEKAGRLDRNLIRDELSKIVYKGELFSTVEFDENRELKEADFEVRIIKNGKNEIY